MTDRIRISRNASSYNNKEYVYSFYSNKLLKFVWNLNLIVGVLTLKVIIISLKAYLHGTTVSHATSLRQAYDIA